MSITETVLVYVLIPIGVFLLLAALVFGPGAARQPRYRPGRPWTHEPVWFLPAGGSATGTSTMTAIESGAPASSAAAGGATGEW